MASGAGAGAAGVVCLVAGVDVNCVDAVFAGGGLPRTLADLWNWIVGIQEVKEGSAILWLLDNNPVVIVTPAALIASSLTCGLWCSAILWSDRVHVPRALRMGAVLRAVIVVAGIALTVVPAIGIYRYVVGLMG